MTNRTVIGVTGASGSGKSCLVRDLALIFKRNQVCVLSQDEYYIERQLQERDAFGYINFDKPSALDLEAFENDLMKLRTGQSVIRRKYQYNNQGQNVTETTEYQSAPVIIVEGLFIHTDSLKSSIDYLVYMHADEHLCLSRRIHRDKKERNYQLDEILHRYEHHVTPSFKKYIEPIGKEADLFINNNESYDQGLTLLKIFIADRLSKDSRALDPEC